MFCDFKILHGHTLKHATNFALLPECVKHFCGRDIAWSCHSIDTFSLGRIVQHNFFAPPVNLQKYCTPLPKFSKIFHSSPIPPPPGHNC